MKSGRLVVLIAVIFICSVVTFAQTQPNLENGWKPFGSYEGSHLDTVNVMNGNLMFHGPLTPDTPQRGSLKVSNALYATSKDWQIVCHTMTNSGLVCNWQKGGAGVSVLPTPGLSVRRTRNNSYFGGGGTTQSVAYGYTVVTPDQGTHQLHGVAGTQDANGEATQFDSTDLSGYHVVLSAQDPTTGIFGHVTVTDRSGNHYEGNFGPAGNCGKAPTNFMIGSPGPVQPVVDDAPAGEQYCSEAAMASLVTDNNGNQVSVHGPGNPNPTMDTLGKIPALTTADFASDFSGCVSSQPIYVAYLYHYQDPNGVAHNVKLCAAEIPIHTAFNQLIGSGPYTYPEAVSSTDPSTGFHFRPIVTAIFDSGTKYTFDYDNYGEITTIGLPTGGSISYTWGTISYLSCNDGNPTRLSRAVATRTLNDGQGHSYPWTYQWGSIAGGSLTNTVTDPLHNDTVHVFSDLSLLIGPTANCKFYETSTIQYQGAVAANNPMQRVDTTYSAANVASDTDDVSPANVFATDVITTIFPSGKVKKVHKDPDTGLGPGLPIFGNTVRELEYDWGQGAPGPLLRETDTVYQWQKTDASGNRPYLTANMLDLPASVVVIDPVAANNAKSGCPINAAGGTASCISETDYFFDEPAYLTSPSPIITTQHISPPASVRGNQTTVSHWLNTASAFVSSHTKWYDTGEPFQKIDPLGHTTTFSYDTAYAGAYVTQTCSPLTGTVAHCVSGTYDFNTGVLTSLTNENATTQASGNTPGDSAHTSNFAYDFMFRLTSAQAPPDLANGSARATTSFGYSTASIPWSVTRTKPITNALNDSATSLFDGLGRVYEAQHAMPSGPPSTVDTTFDLAGRVATVSNPYFALADPTYGLTQTQYDALDRATQVTKQDGSISKVDYSLGNCTTSTDESGKMRRGCSDALGRLVEVDEPNQNAPATFAQANITINGIEQSNPLPGASGTGSVIISGSEGSSQVCTDPEPPARPVCHTIPDSGTIGIQVGTYPVLYVTYGSGSTGATLALALQQGFHNDGSSPVDAAIDPSNSAKINFTARGIGAATNYPITYYNGADFSVGGLSALSGGRDASSSPDTGTVTITVNGTPYSTTYSGSDTGATIATRLANAISAGSFANATAPGNVITLTAKSTGAVGDYSLSAAWTYDTAHFAGPSFTASAQASALSGGYSVGDVDNQTLRTLYSYDALGNLLCVEQHGNVAGTGCSAAPSSDATSPWRVRRFTYDSLGRLLTAKNPESGTITYSYDVDGNLLQKTSPAANHTDGATQTISYCYDELHRMTGRAYSAQSCQGTQLPTGTAVVSYVYDSGDNAKGKLTSLTDQAGTATYSYDPLGRLTGETRVISGISKSLSYAYNLDGPMKSLTYPSGATVAYAPDSAGRILSAIDSGNGINYVTGATYGPDGAITGFVSGNTVTNRFLYTLRLQPCRMIAATGGTLPTLCNDTSHGNVLDLGYDFHVGNGASGSGSDNGNVFGITNYKDSTRNQSFTYDALNRLTSAQNAGTNCAATMVNGKTEYWGNSYGYDAWGNLLQKTVTKCSAENLTVTAAVNNQLQGGYTYDVAGNMTHDATSGLNYTYDQENRITGAGGYTYTYDGDGNRVKKTNGSTGTLYWYMTPGIVGESDLAGVMKSEYVFFGGERVARRDFPGGSVFYYFSDHLKTASVITDAAGTIKAESDYYPWGGELQFVANDSNHYKFTGKERDAESGLDYFGARYYSNGLGRFITPDWAAKATAVPYAEFADPQSLNLYSYVRNNPVTKADLDGHCDPVSCVFQVLQYVGVHVGSVGTGIQSTRQEYVQRAKDLKASGGTPEQRTQLAQEFREKGPALGRQLAKQEAADPARIAARAAKTDSQLAESVGRTSSEVSGLAKTAGVVGKVGTGVAVGVAVYNVATAPAGEKMNTAMKEGGGLAGALGGGELGAEFGSAAGPWGALGGGIAGAIGGGILGKSAVDKLLSSPKSEGNPDGYACAKAGMCGQK